MGYIIRYISEKNTEKYKRDKSIVLIKVVRAKLTSTWEGAGVGGKKTYKKLFLDKGANSYIYPRGE